MSNVRDIETSRRAGDTILLRHLLTSKEHFSANNSETIATIDPDLSKTRNIVAKLLKEGHGENAMGQMMRAGEFLMLRGIDDSKNNKILHTQAHVKALQHCAQVFENLSPNLKKATMNLMLDIFSLASNRRRKDLVKQPKFPWNSAVDVAIDTPSEIMNKRFIYRFNILRNAPKKLLATKAFEHAQKNEFTILDVLEDEYDGFSQIDYMREQALYELIAAMPTGNVRIARSTLFWAIKATATGLWRRQEKENREIPEPYISLLWERTKTQWETLSPTDQGLLLRAEMLNWINGLSRERLKNPEYTPLTDGMRILEQIAGTMSEEGKQYFVKEYVAAFNIVPKQIIPTIIAHWFPDEAKAIEAQRPKTIFQRILNKTLSK